MRSTIPVSLPNKANTYEIHFHPVFWKEISPIVSGLKKYIRGALYWIGPAKIVKETEQVIGYYSKIILAEETSGPVKMTVWVRGKLDVDGIKAVLDGCQLGGRIHNDRQVQELHIYRLPGKNESFDLEIEKMQEDITNESAHPRPND
jgi:hypothetical protein